MAGVKKVRWEAGLPQPRVPDVGRFYSNAMAMPTPPTRFL